jgi:hypothetical protein
MAAEEIGVSVEHLPNVIGTTHDTNLTGLLEGDSIDRSNYENGPYQELATKIAGWRRSR